VEGEREKGEEKEREGKASIEMVAPKPKSSDFM